MASHSPLRPAGGRWAAAAYWVMLCAPPLAVYALTMAPGLLVRGDTPKFQYLGAVLGTAHSPGYPLYVQLSWLFSQLPFETVAWRVNFMTMLFGVVAVALVGWTARRLGAGRAGALFAGWGLAFGRVFWEQATTAEVYTLSTVLQAATLGLALRWQQTRRERDLLAAVAVAALALGHHPTIVMTVPALVLFVLLVDWRVLLRPLTIAASLGLVALGLSQYLFVMLRTVQRAPYIEAHASTLDQLLVVLRGRQYADSLFAYSLRDFFATRFSAVGSFVTGELTLAGLVLAGIGAVALVRRNWRAAVLLAAGALVVFGFACSYDVPDIQVFVIPVFVVLWLLAGVGVAALVQALIASPRPRAVLAAACAVAFSTTAIARSYVVEDLSGETFDAEYFDAMMNQIEKPAAIYFEYENPVGHALRYQILVERRDIGGGRVAFVNEGPDLRSSYTSRPGNYAIHPHQLLLETRGLLLAPVTLEASLSRQLGGLPASATIAIAIPPGIAASLSADDLEFLRAAGIGRLPSSAGLAAIVRRGRPLALETGGASAVAQSDGELSLAVRVDGAHAGVLLDGHEVAAADDAALVVAMDVAGRVLWSVQANRARGLLPRLDMTRRPLFRVVGTSPCDTTVAGTWTRFAGPALIGPRLAVWVPAPRGRTAPADGTAVVYAGGDEIPLNFYGISTDGSDLHPVIENFDMSSPGDATRLADRMSQDRQTSQLGTRFVARVEFALSRRSKSSEMSAILTAAPHPAVLLADLVAAEGSPVRFCISPARGAVAFEDPAELQIDLLREHQEFVGAGWSSLAEHQGQRVRRTTSDRSTVQFTLQHPLPLVVRVHAEPEPRDTAGARSIRIEVNGRMLDARPLSPDAAVYEWDVPATSWRDGYNRVVLVGPTAPGSRGDRGGPGASDTGLIVSSFQVAREAR